MFRLRTALATFALFVGLGSTSQAQVFTQFGGLGVAGVQGNVQLGFGGFSGFRSGYVAQQFGVGGFPYYGTSSFYGAGVGVGVPYYPPYGYYYAPVPQTYNAMGSLIDSIERSTSSYGGWRRWPY